MEYIFYSKSFCPTHILDFSFVLFWLKSTMFWKGAVLSGKSMNFMLLFAFILANL